MKYEVDVIDETIVTLDTYNSDLNLVINASKYSAEPLTKEGFAFMWAGARASHGAGKGKFCFEVKVIEHLDVSHLPADEPNPHVVRVGFSVDSTTLQLGEDPLSYGYGGTGKISTNCQFKDFGPPFMAGDVVLAVADMDGDMVQIGFAKNGKFVGWAYKVKKADLQGKALFPHVLSKNCSFEVNFGQRDEPYFKLPDAVKNYTFIGCLPMDQRVGGSRPPETREACEMIMMCGLPGAGKSVWAADYSLKNQEKKYNILGTNNIIDKMKVMGLPRKRNYAGRWDVLIQMATKCLNSMFAIGSKLRRNYILDQTNVYPTAQRRKMRNFDGFKRIAVVVVPTEAEYKRRCDKRDREEGKEVPDSAVLEMKANFKLPEKGDIFDEVIFTEMQRDEAEKLVKQYNEEGKAAMGPARKQFRPNEPMRDNKGFDNRKGNFGGRGDYGNYDNQNMQGPNSYGGNRGSFNSRGGFNRGRGGGNDSGFGGRSNDRGGYGDRGGFDSSRGGREGFDRNFGGYDNNRDMGGFDDNRGGRGGYDNFRGNDSGRGGRGGFDSRGRGRGGYESDRGGRGGYDSSQRGGYDGARGGGRGGYDGARGGGRGGYDGASGGGRGSYDGARGGGRGGYDGASGGGRGSYDGASSGGRGGYDGARGGGRGSYDGARGGGRGGYDGASSGGRGSYDGARGGGRGSYDGARGGGRGGYGSSRGGGRNDYGSQDSYGSRGDMYGGYGDTGKDVSAGGYGGSDRGYDKSSRFDQGRDSYKRDYSTMDNPTGGTRGTYGYSDYGSDSYSATDRFDKNYDSSSSDYSRGTSSSRFQSSDRGSASRGGGDMYPRDSGYSSGYATDSSTGMQSSYSKDYGYSSGSYGDYKSPDTADTYASRNVSSTYAASSLSAKGSDPAQRYAGSGASAGSKYSQGGTGYSGSGTTRTTRWGAETPQATAAADAYSATRSQSYAYPKSDQSATSYQTAQTYDYQQGAASNTASQQWMTSSTTSASTNPSGYGSTQSQWMQYGQQPNQYYSQ